MSIQDKLKKINPYLEFDIKEDIFIILAIILIGLSGFGLGKLSALEKNREPVSIIKSSSLKCNNN